MFSFEPRRIPAWLAPGLRGEVGLPFDEAVAVVREPAGHGGRVAVAHRPLQDRKCEPVDLEEDKAGNLRVDPLARTASDPLDHAQGVRVVVVRAEEDVEDDGDGGGDQRGQERPPEAVDLDRVVRDRGRLRGA